MIKQHSEDALGEYGLLTKKRENKSIAAWSKYASLQWTEEDKRVDLIDCLITTTDTSDVIYAGAGMPPELGAPCVRSDAPVPADAILTCSLAQTAVLLVS